MRARRRGCGNGPDQRRQSEFFNSEKPRVKSKYRNKRQNEGGARSEDVKMFECESVGDEAEAVVSFSSSTRLLGLSFVLSACGAVAMRNAARLLPNLETAGLTRADFF